MFELILGNVCSLGAMAADSVSSTCKTKKNMLLIQCISQVFYVISAFVLKGYSAIAQNGVAIFRNLFAAYDKSNKLVEVILVILPVILGIAFNNRGIIGLLPVVANLEYTLAVFKFKGNPRMLKYAFIINAIMFCVFNFAIYNFVGGISAIVIMVTTMLALMKDRSGIDTAEVKPENDNNDKNDLP